jgi:hypothetical protein
MRRGKAGLGVVDAPSLQFEAYLARERVSAAARRQTDGVPALIEISERYRDLDDFELSELTHTFPEWISHYQDGGATPIAWQEMLSAQNKSDMIAVVERDETALQVFDDFFGPEP